MPRIAVISDIHANLHALCAVIEDVQNVGCTEVVCLGDVVGYCAYPRECLDYIRSLNCPVVKGNHDAAVVTVSEELAGVTPPPSTERRMNPMARQAMEWTCSQLDADSLTWLGRLPYTRLVNSKITLVHACLDQPKQWNYILNAKDAKVSFTRQFAPVCFHGHTHVPRVFCWNGRDSEEVYEVREALYTEGVSRFVPTPGLKYFINVGSVGQPRDNDPRACYVVYDTDDGSVTFRRVVYDVAAAKEAILQVGLPEYLANRLENGC